MKKRSAFILLLFAIVVTLIVLIVLSSHPKGAISDDPFTPPAPVSFNERQQEGEEHEQDRAAFFAMMHRSAPGTDYRKMDAILLKKKMMQRKDRSGFRSDDWDTLANGYAIGAWNEVGSYNVAGRIWATDIDFASDKVYACSDGGNVWKGNLDGSSWEILNENFKIANTCFLRKEGSRLITVTQQWNTQGVFYTDDEGLSFTEATGLENVALYGYVFDAAMMNDSLHTMYVLAYNWDYDSWNGQISLFRSADMGTSFTLIKNYAEPDYGGSGKFNLWSSRYGEPAVYMIQNDSFNVLTDTGEPLFMSTIPLAVTGDEILCGYENGSDLRFYAGVYNGTEGTTRIYRSIDAGATWVETGGVDSYFFSNTSFNCAATIPDKLYIGGIDVYSSNNAGADWLLVNHWYDYYNNNEIYLHADIPFIQSFEDTSAGTELLLISTDGGLFKSDDYANTVQNITLENMRNAQYYDTYTYTYDPDIIYAGAQDQGYQVTDHVEDNKYFFDQVQSGDYGHIVSTTGGADCWMVYPGFIMYVPGPEATVSDLVADDFTGSGYLWLPPIMADPDNNEICWWAGGKYMYEVKKNASGLTYTEQDFNFSNGTPYGAISAIAHSPINENYWYVLNNYGTFYYSTDRGVTWTKTESFDGPDSHYFYGSVILPSATDLGTVYIGGSGYDNPGVYISTNNGVNFTSMSEGLPSTLVYDMAGLPNDSLLFAATEVGPYVYVKDENLWYDIAAEMAPYQVYWSVEYVEGIHTARFGTYGRGIFEFKLDYPEPPLYISEAATQSTSHLYPSPAASFINIGIAEDLVNAVVSIFDLQGNVIVQQKNFNFSKDVPRRLDIETLPAGNYLVKVQTNNKSFVNKFIKY